MICYFLLCFVPIMNSSLDLLHCSIIVYITYEHLLWYDHKMYCATIIKTKISCRNYHFRWRLFNDSHQSIIQYVCLVTYQSQFSLINLHLESGKNRARAYIIQERKLIFHIHATVYSNNYLRKFSHPPSSAFCVFFRRLVVRLVKRWTVYTSQKNDVAKHTHTH